MEECYKCHEKETKAILFDVILPHEIGKICGKCSVKENRPIFRDSSSLDVKERTLTNKERLEKISGVKLDNNPKITGISEADKNLKEIVKSNFSRTFTQIPEMEKEMVENFHWIIMRARRMKHFSQEQLARAINEPIEIIQMIEKGNIPQKREVIRKLENFLSINIRRDDAPSVIEERKKFDPKNSEEFTILDLKRLQENGR